MHQLVCPCHWSRCRIRLAAPSFTTPSRTTSSVLGFGSPRYTRPLGRWLPPLSRSTCLVDATCSTVARTLQRLGMSEFRVSPRHPSFLFLLRRAVQRSSLNLRWFGEGRCPRGTSQDWLRQRFEPGPKWRFLGRPAESPRCTQKVRCGARSFTAST